MKHVLGFLVLIPVSVFIWGWAISTLFNWFVSPLGVDNISFVHALGLSCLLGLFKVGLATQADVKENSEPWAHFVGQLIGVSLIVGMGWVYNQFM